MVKYWVQGILCNFEQKVNNPIFIIGYNNSGKSLIKKNIACNKEIAVYPGEANELWHPGAYPWRYSDLSRPPIWYDPHFYVEKSLAHWSGSHKAKIKKEFASFQMLSRKSFLVIESAMIAFLTPQLIELFPDARFIHIYRDGRVVSYLAAKKEAERMDKDPEPYKKTGFYYESFDDLLCQMANYWRLTMKEIDQMVKGDMVDSNKILELSYEGFCSNPERQMQRLYNFIGVPVHSFSNSILENKNDMDLQEVSKNDYSLLNELLSPVLKFRGYIV